MNKIKPYAIATGCCLLILWGVFRIFNIDPSLPLNYNGDAIVHYNFAKNIEETGSWAANPRFGAPTGQILLDFPLTENFHLLLIKILIASGLNWYQSINAFFILSFPLVAVFALWSMQKIGIKIYIAIPLSIIYTFIPYHLLRGVNHLFLAGYFVVPVAVYVAYRFASNNLPSLFELFVVTILISSSGAYYTFMSVFLIGVGGLFGMLKVPNRKLLGALVKSLAMILFFFFLNYLPTFIYTQNYGTNYNATVRQASETELYGLKITQLILPLEDHNLSLFNKIQKRYKNYGSTATNENQYSALGLTAGLGFIFLLIWSVFKYTPFKFDKELSTKLDIMATFNLACVLFATVGGFAVILSTYINATLRSVNRISIFIAFISLVAVGLLLQRISSFKISLGVAWLVLLIALVDQISLGTVQNFMRNSSDFSSLVKYADEIERSASENIKIFTLPFGQYPEGVDKRLMRVALLTNSVTWSTGTEKWRAANFWQHKVYNQETKTFLESIIKEGFTGLLIDTKEIDPSKLDAIEQELSISPMQSEQKDYSFYDLKPYADSNKIAYLPTEVLFYVSGNCLYDHQSDFYCVDNGRIEFESYLNTSVDKTLHYKIELPDGKVEVSNIVISVGAGKSHYILKPNTGTKVFPIPSSVPIWPLNIGYPNFIVREISLQ